MKGRINSRLSSSSPPAAGRGSLHAETGVYKRTDAIVLQNLHQWFSKKTSIHIRKLKICRFVLIKNDYAMMCAKTVLLFCGVLVCVSSIAQQKQGNKKQAKPKPALGQVQGSDHFNVAAFSEKRKLVQEKYRVPGTDSIVTETYYVWLLPR